MFVNRKLNLVCAGGLLLLLVYCQFTIDSAESKGSKSNKSSSKQSSSLASTGETGTGTTTRYWDCCKPACAWKDNVGSLAAGKTAVKTCAADGRTTVDANTPSGCNGGSSFMCANQQPQQINSTLAYGFVAANVNGHQMKDFCCACYSLTFPNEPKLKGKTMIVQVTNTGSDLNSNHFDIQMPGGGVGIFNGCQKQYNSPADGWGKRYGGIDSESQCSTLPADLQPGCKFRFEWFKNADNPAMAFKRVKCPAKIVQQSGCQRSDDPQ